jgi:hypothetical protein
MRALRDNGVYGSSMVPYLQVLRSVFDSAQECADDAEEAPAEFSESDDVSSDDVSSSEEASSEEDTEEDSTQSSEDTDGDKKRKRARVEGLEPKSKETPKKRSSDERATANAKQNSKGASGSERAQTVLPPSAYQIEMRAKYKLFSRFLGAYFAKERIESASVASLVSHPDASSFADAEVVAFLDMLQRENKVMLHEGTVMII